VQARRTAAWSMDQLKKARRWLDVPVFFALVLTAPLPCSQKSLMQAEKCEGGGRAAFSRGGGNRCSAGIYNLKLGRIHIGMTPLFLQ